MFGIYFNKYDKELEVYKVFSHRSCRKIALLYEKNDFIHVNVRANNFKYITELENEYDFFSKNMIGVNLNVLYSDCINSGMKILDSDSDEGICL